MRFLSQKQSVTLLALALVWSVCDIGYAGKTKAKTTHVDVIIFDLGEPGVELTGEQETDEVLAGHKHTVSWPDAASEDGFLVINATALAEKGWKLEVRDTASRLEGHVMFTTGHALRAPDKKRWNYKRLMVMLTAFDENKDKKIAKGDFIFSLLGVFRDHDGNGVIDPAEVTSLDSAGISAVKLFMGGPKKKDADKNVLQQIKVEKSDGSKGVAYLVRLKLR